MWKKDWSKERNQYSRLYTDFEKTKSNIETINKKIKTWKKTISVLQEGRQAFGVIVSKTNWFKGTLMQI